MCKVYTFRFLKYYNVFGYNDSGMIDSMIKYHENLAAEQSKRNVQSDITSLKKHDSWVGSPVGMGGPHDEGSSPRGGYTDMEGGYEADYAVDNASSSKFKSGGSSVLGVFQGWGLRVAGMLRRLGVPGLKKKNSKE